MRTGRTNDLNRRRGEHARDQATKDLRFEIDRRTDNYAQQRGREQIIHDRYNPPLNVIEPIRANHPLRVYYLRAGNELGD